MERKWRTVPESRGEVEGESGGAAGPSSPKDGVGEKEEPSSSEVFLERRAVKKEKEREKEKEAPLPVKKMWGPRRAGQTSWAPKTIKINLEGLSAGLQELVRSEELPLVLEDEVWAANQKLYAIGAAIRSLSDPQMAAAVSNGLDSLLDALSLPRIRPASPEPPFQPNHY